MKRRIGNVGLVLLATAVLVIATPIVRAAGAGQHAMPLAGPWYTAQELKALIAYSKASFEQKKALLAGTKVSGVSGRSSGLPLAGPWYTPQELKALIAYSKASFEQKKALLAGTKVTGVSATGGFHWGDASIGAGVAVGCMLFAGGLTAWLARTRSRRGLRHT